MESEQEDSSVGICNGSLGRVVMQVVKKNDENGHANKVKVSFKNLYFLFSCLAIIL